MMHILSLLLTSCLLLKEAQPWSYQNGIFHNSIWLEHAAGVFHMESAKGRYMLTYKEAIDKCKTEGGTLATYAQLEAARQIGFHMCAAGWYDKGRVGYPINKAGRKCGVGKIGIVDYGRRVNKSERWDVYCHRMNYKECGGVFTDQKRLIKSPGFPQEYRAKQTCSWHIRVRLNQRICVRFLVFDVEDDVDCMADYLAVYDSYDDYKGLVDKFCGNFLPYDIVTTGNVMTIKFISDASINAKGFLLQYTAINATQPLRCPDI